MSKDDDVVPEEHALRFPPFPPIPEVDGEELPPFDQYVPKGISIPPLPAGTYTDADVRMGLNGWAEDVTENGRDHTGQEFTKIDVDRTPEVAAAARAARQRAYNARHRNRTRVSLEHSWKLGTEENWDEPHGTCIEDYDISRPPFARLMDATLAFLDSRFDAFENRDIKQLFLMARYAFGLKTDFSLIHWPGTGPNAGAFSPPHAAKRRAPYKESDLYRAGAIGEACPLLRDTEKAVRGFLALARREAEAVWGTERALVLIDIVTTFLAYINVHKVFTDDYLAPCFVRAEQLARTAAAATKQAKVVEDILDEGEGLNVSSWILFGGTYLDRQGAIATQEEEVDSDDDGGWEKPESKAELAPPTPAEARKTLEGLIAPLDLDSIKSINYMPYARRRIVEVIPPDPSNPGPAFMKTHTRLVTAPAPWTEEEAWRDVSRHEEHCEKDKEETLFEKEEATLDEPDTLSIWVKSAPPGIIGAGIRARWAEVGGRGHTWWILCLKDFVLPSFWQSTEQERQVAENDPVAPYPAIPTLPDAASDAAATDAATKDMAA